MPWQGVTPVELRQQLVEAWTSGAGPMRELCAQYGIAPKTGYKWASRFAGGGLAALAEQSRRPHRIARPVSPLMRAQLCEARVRHPTWGARKIRYWIARRWPLTAWPSHVTIAAIWREAGLVRGRPPRPRPYPRARPDRAHPTAPNDLWTIDFKGDFRVGTGARCYPLTVRDLYSRYTLRCDALAVPSGPATARSLARTFATYGLPRAIRSDNGGPFVGVGLGGLTQLNLWWLELGIALQPITLGHPEENGAHEQFHRVLKADTARPPAASLAAQQRRFARFVTEYNTERPHDALAGAVPAEYYVPSPRPYPARRPAVDYPGHWDRRRVMANGRITFHGVSIFLSRALHARDVGLEEIDDGLWTIYFAHQPLARWSAHTQQVVSWRG
jgi:transposase InsO family protein